MFQDRKFRKDTIKKESPYDYGSIIGELKAEVFDGEAIDTNVDITITPFCITWANRECLMKDLAVVIEKYKI
jgi:hypothetical protein